jgi:hypothetical protein
MSGLLIGASSNSSRSAAIAKPPSGCQRSALPYKIDLRTTLPPDAPSEGAAPESDHVDKYTPSGTATRHHRISCNGRAHERMNTGANLTHGRTAPIGRTTDVATGHDVAGAHEPLGSSSFRCRFRPQSESQHTMQPQYSRLPTSIVLGNRSSHVHDPTQSRATPLFKRHIRTFLPRTVDHGGKSYRRSGSCTRRRFHLLTAAGNIVGRPQAGTASFFEPSAADKTRTLSYTLKPRHIPQSLRIPTSLRQTHVITLRDCSIGAQRCRP